MSDNEVVRMIAYYESFVDVMPYKTQKWIVMSDAASGWVPVRIPLGPAGEIQAVWQGPNKPQTWVDTLLLNEEQAPDESFKLQSIQLWFEDADYDYIYNHRWSDKNGFKHWLGKSVTVIDDNETFEKSYTVDFYTNDTEEVCHYLIQEGYRKREWLHKQRDGG